MIIEAGWPNGEIPAWHAQAGCRELLPTNAWYPPRGSNTALMRALRALCGSCPIRVQCIGQGLHERFGWFGGLSERDRIKVRRHGEITLANRDVIMWDRDTDEVLVVSDSEPLELPIARWQLEQAWGLAPRAHSGS